MLKIWKPYDLLEPETFFYLKSHKDPDSFNIMISSSWRKYKLQTVFHS